ncbi:MAG: DegT/DnrJ/EryC1/StrS family aminotransferase [Candidatus Margulisiibacteriota bacterium]|jgi:dTDP-4-amino-4,6-dideoxygalactose transaminase
MIKFFDLERQYQEIQKEIEPKLLEIFKSQYFILGPEVQALEKELAAYLNVKHAITCASGTDALLLALSVFNIAPGDEVITTAFTFFATAGSISRVGAVPVFVDIDDKTFNIDPKKIEEKITSKTKAIIPVHLYGQPAAMNEINQIAKKYNLKVIEDACQAIGAEYKGQQVGVIGDVGCFSFFPTKNLGAFGDAGLVTTNDDETARLLNSYRVHGSEKRYYHDYIGWNSRCDAIQAAVLRIKLKYLNTWAKKREATAKFYDDFFNTNLPGKVTPPFIAEATTKHVYNQYVVKAKSRDQLKAYLAEKGIGSEIYYPVPLHMQKCYLDLGYKKGDLPVTDQLTEEVLALPIFPELTDLEKQEVAAAIKSFYI